MAFGALECCRKCNWGQLVVDSEGYRCIAREKWVKCNELTEDPLRKSFVVPEDLQQRYDFLYVLPFHCLFVILFVYSSNSLIALFNLRIRGEYECKIQKRVFEKTLENVENVSLTSDVSISLVRIFVQNSRIFSFVVRSTAVNSFIYRRCNIQHSVE